MANLRRIMIIGVMQADTVQRADINATAWFALFASPNSGLRIEYADEIPYVDPQGKQTSGYVFRIEGYENTDMMGDHAVQGLIDELKGLGCVIDFASARLISDDLKSGDLILFK